MNPEKIDEVLAALEESTKAAFALVRQMVAARGDDDEWTRLPPAKERCPVSRFSRSQICRLINIRKVRGKTVHGCRFYSAADVRKLLKD